MPKPLWYVAFYSVLLYNKPAGTPSCSKYFRFLATEGHTNHIFTVLPLRIRMYIFMSIGLGETPWLFMLSPLLLLTSCHMTSFITALR